MAGCCPLNSVKYRGAFFSKRSLVGLHVLQTRFHCRAVLLLLSGEFVISSTKVFEMPREVFSIIVFLESLYMVIISRKMVIGQGTIRQIIMK